MTRHYDTFNTLFEEEFGDEWRFIYQQNQQRLSLKNERIAIKKLASIIPAVFALAKVKSFHGMTVRDLSLETGISMGGLYKYFSNKEDLIIMIHRALVAMTEHILLLQEPDNPFIAIDQLLSRHLYISERLKKWFYFVFMETKHLDKPLFSQFVQSEQLVEQVIVKHIVTARDNGQCRCSDPFLTATVFKSVLQEWYLKSHKYQSQDITLEHYKNHVMQLRQQLLPELSP